MINFHYYPLATAHEAEGIVVVIDVLRAFTTAAIAFDMGANMIYPVAGIDDAFYLRKKMPGSLLMGEINGVKPIGFDLGNSPAEISEIDLTEKILIQRTSAGTQGVIKAVKAEMIIAASFVVAAATANFIRLFDPSTVSFIITGESQGRDGVEDLSCGEYIEALLKGLQPNQEEYIKRVKSSSVGQLFLDRNNTIFKYQDLLLSTQIDRYPFYLKVCQKNGNFIMTKNCPN